MFLVNLGWLQLAAVFGTLSAGMVALYLWDRSKRRLTVPTLRFWVASEKPAAAKHRKRIQQPLSLVLQLLAVALLLFAVARPRLGGPESRPRDHVLILDTSAFMGARSGSGTLMDRARTLALRYAQSLPPGDRLMVVRADALATPATAFESSRGVLEQAVKASRPGATALDLERAIEFARRAQKIQGGPRGEIVYAGAGRTADTPSPSRGSERLRVLPVDGNVANCGVRRMGVRRSGADPAVWDVLVTVKNYGAESRTIPLGISFAGAPVATRRLTLAPRAEQEVAFQYRTRAAGLLEARLLEQDGFPEDDRATLELPALAELRVTVYSDEPELLRPALAANPLVAATFRKPAEYGRGDAADVLILDRFAPPALPETNAIWLEPPANGSPLRVRATVADAQVAKWRSDHPLATGLRARDLRLQSAEVFAPGAGDAAIAEVDAGPVVVAHSGRPRFVVLGFHPGRGNLKFELTTPLLFANILRWMSPDVFRSRELNAGTPGTVTVEVGSDPGQEARVLSAEGADLPYSVDGPNLRFFAGTPGTVRVTVAEREMEYSLTLPEVGGTVWTPPPGAVRGLPPAVGGVPSYRELWPWLALAGAAMLATEWMLFGGGLPRRRKNWAGRAARLVPQRSSR